jgi:hypothetical protein
MTIDRFAIVTPTYEDESSTRRVLAELAAEFGKRVTVVLVDDGSVCEPADIKWITEYGIDGALITLTQNMGHQKAIAIGLCFAADHFPELPVVTMDSDGEDVPSTISILLERMHDQADVVVAQRKNRMEKPLFKAFYFTYKLIFKLFSGRKINFGNFALYKPVAVLRLSRMATLWLHIASTVLSSKLRIEYVSIDRGPRYAGKSKMNFVALALHGFRSLMVFAEDVLVRVGIFCGVIAALSMLGVVLAVFLKLIGFATPGWFSIIVGMLLLIMLQTGVLTLTTLLLTGVMKGVLSVPPDYRIFIREVTEAHPRGHA